MSLEMITTPANLEISGFQNEQMQYALYVPKIATKSSDKYIHVHVVIHFCLNY